MDDMPSDCLDSILGHIFYAHDLLRCTQVSTRLRKVASSDRLWWSMCGVWQRGGTFNLTDARHELGGSTGYGGILGRFVHAGTIRPNRRDGDWMGSEGSPIGRAPMGESWLQVFRRATVSLRSTVCIDAGRGTTKYGRAEVWRAQELRMGAYGGGHAELEATQDTLFEAALWRLNINKADLPNWKLIIAEPFRLAAASKGAARALWWEHLERTVLPGLELKKFCIIDSANLCLLANGLTSGVVVHIGLDDVFVVPVLGGTVVESAVQESSPGGHALTTYFADLLQQTDAADAIAAATISREMAARNAKDLYCEVWPTRLSEHFGHNPFHNERTLARTDAPTAWARVANEYTTLGWERFLPAEALFDNRMNDEGGIQDMVLRAAEQASSAVSSREGVDADVWRRGLRGELLKRVVLSGGTTEMPGFGRRLEKELEAALTRDPTGAKPPVVVWDPVVVGGQEQTIWSGASILAGMTGYVDAQGVQTPMEN